MRIPPGPLSSPGSFSESQEMIFLCNSPKSVSPLSLSLPWSLRISLHNTEQGFPTKSLFSCISLILAGCSSLTSALHFVEHLPRRMRSSWDGMRVGMKVMGWDRLLCPSDSAQNPGHSQGKDEVTKPITAHF